MAGRRWQIADDTDPVVLASPAAAVGTDMLFAVPTKTVGSLVHVNYTIQ